MAHIESPNIVITLNRSNPVTRELFVINALTIADEEGLYVNEILRLWNAYRLTIGKPPSNYAAFRKLVWNMKHKGIIEKVPDNEKRDEDLKGTAPFPRSFYRLTQKYLKSVGRT